MRERIISESDGRPVGMLFACRELVHTRRLWRLAQRSRALASRRLHFVVGRYMLVGLISNALDLSIFLLVHRATGSIFAATYTARGISMLVNYALVSRIVFQAGGPVIATFPKYAALVLLSGFLVWQMVAAIAPLVGGRMVIAKLSAEGLVYLFNFAMQRWLIFRRSRRAG